MTLFTTNLNAGIDVMERLCHATANQALMELVLVCYYLCKSVSKYLLFPTPGALPL